MIDFGPVDYSSTIPPASYRCGSCGAYGCKLWREYNTCADYTELVCCDCAGKSQNEDVSSIDAEGNIHGEYGKCDQIGWRVPAVPTEDGSTYWGYTSVPQEGVRWWRVLPTRVSAAA